MADRKIDEPFKGSPIIHSRYFSSQKRSKAKKEQVESKEPSLSLENTTTEEDLSALFLSKPKGGTFWPVDKKLLDNSLLLKGIEEKLRR